MALRSFIEMRTVAVMIFYSLLVYIFQYILTIFFAPFLSIFIQELLIRINFRIQSLGYKIFK